MTEQLTQSINAVHRVELLNCENDLIFLKLTNIIIVKNYFIQLIDFAITFLQTAVIADHFYVI